MNGYIDYLQYTLLNDQAARNVWQDALNTRERLAHVAGSLRSRSHPQLKKNGYHPVNFLRHRYLIVIEKLANPSKYVAIKFL